MENIRYYSEAYMCAAIVLCGCAGPQYIGRAPGTGVDEQKNAAWSPLYAGLSGESRDIGAKAYMVWMDADDMQKHSVDRRIYGFVDYREPFVFFVRSDLKNDYQTWCRVVAHEVLHIMLLHQYGDGDSGHCTDSYWETLKKVQQKVCGTPEFEDNQPKGWCEKTLDTPLEMSPY